ncbi:PREDICTED: fascin-2 isoform X3 [Rhinopithecus bieti]|uniref:fascin-2 isoform X3 n=1 Tax=Rhinopithecus bieti TaxID=61621 RepID=UPI00083BF736|nr:PREDICTED: fascin-2 isoform X3 [Rhinopithecus bieti]
MGRRGRTARCDFSILQRGLAQGRARAVLGCALGSRWRRVATTTLLEPVPERAGQLGLGRGPHGWNWGELGGRRTGRVSSCTSARGVNVSANQDDELDHETFLMQIDQETKKCTFYSSTGGYWTLVTHGGIQATATQASANTMFEMEWRGRRVALKASNGRYVCMKKNGQLAAISDFVGKDEEFTLKLINRPILVLRGLDGFVCHRRGSNQLDTNRSVYDVFHLSFSDGAYQIRGARRAGWARGSGGRSGRWAGHRRQRRPVAQAAAADSGTRAATAACAATANAPRTSSSSSANAAAWPSAPGAASTCAAAPRACCAPTPTHRPGPRFGSTEAAPGPAHRALNRVRPAAARGLRVPLEGPAAVGGGGPQLSPNQSAPRTSQCPGTRVQEVALPCGWAG